MTQYTRTCRECDQEFEQLGSSKDGNICRPCKSAYQRAYWKNLKHVKKHGAKPPPGPRTKPERVHPMICKVWT